MRKLITSAMILTSITLVIGDAAAQTVACPPGQAIRGINFVTRSLICVSVLDALAPYVTIVNGPINGVDGPHIIFSGVNVHIQSGSGATTDTTNLGNLLIGYNEPRNTTDITNRTGSHTVIIGPGHQFTASGGLLAGMTNTVTADHASVSGGLGNVASGTHASVTGGSINIASGPRASVSGGGGNQATAPNSSVSAGSFNKATGGLASVSGGGGNVASGDRSSVTGGAINTASGDDASINGGHVNTASKSFATVSGGGFNSAAGIGATVSGGNSRTANDQYEWCAGSLCEPN